MTEYNCYQSNQIKHSLYRVKIQNLGSKNIHKACPFNVLCRRSPLTLTQQRQRCWTDSSICCVVLPDMLILSYSDWEWVVTAKAIIDVDRRTGRAFSTDGFGPDTLIFTWMSLVLLPYRYEMSCYCSDASHFIMNCGWNNGNRSVEFLIVQKWTILDRNWAYNKPVLSKYWYLFYFCCIFYFAA